MRFEHRQTGHPKLGGDAFRYPLGLKRSSWMHRFGDEVGGRRCPLLQGIA